MQSAGLKSVTWTINLANLVLAGFLVIGVSNAITPERAGGPSDDLYSGVNVSAAYTAHTATLTAKSVFVDATPAIDGKALVRRLEGFSACAYPDPATHGAPWTVGLGHTGPEVHRGLCVSHAQAETWLDEDYAKAHKAVSVAVRVKLPHNKMVAMTALTVNIGVNNMASSSLVKYINQGDLASASAQFPLWRCAAGKRNKGLMFRRAVERIVFDL